MGKNIIKIKMVDLYPAGTCMRSEMENIFLELPTYTKRVVLDFKGFNIWSLATAQEYCHQKRLLNIPVEEVNIDLHSQRLIDISEERYRKLLKD